MEFWGVEVKAGQSLVVKPGSQKYIHLSQATVGEIKKDKANENVTIFLKIGDQKLVLGILSAEKFPQLSFDLVFEKEFELSHNGKGGSVFCAGYKALVEENELFFSFSTDSYIESDSGSEDDELAVPLALNGKPTKKEEKAIANKSDAAKAASLKKSEKPASAEDDDSEDDDESDDDDDDEDSDDESDEEMLEGDSDDEDDDLESDEETPKKVELNKKRSNESASKTTPLPSKKAKVATPEKTDSKKGGHTATPHPAKKSGKTPLKSESPKSGGQFSCKSCDRSFGSDGALQSHSKAKHGSGK